jgi:flagellar assembly protein FliH
MSDAPSQQSWRPWTLAPLERRTRTQSPAVPSGTANRRREDQISMTLFDLAKEEAQAKGYADGHAEGLERGLIEAEARVRAEHETALAAELALRVAPIGELALAFQAAANQLGDRLAYQLVELAIEAGRQLAGRALDIKPEHILDDIQELMEDHPDLDGAPTLYLNIDDLALAEVQLSHTLAAAGWEARGDVNLARGDCRIETEEREIDASAADRWARLLHAVGHHEH